MIVRNQATGLRCPSCNDRIAASKVIFREESRCPQCGSALHVSGAYGRALVLLSLVIGFFLVWIVGVRDMVHFCLFWLPTAFLVLTVVVRVAPFVLPLCWSRTVRVI